MNTYDPIGALTIDSTRDGALLSVVLSGSAELRTSIELASALLKVHQEALTAAVSDVTVDFRSVEFMNSAALSAFLQWFNRLRETPKYKVVLIYDPQVRWQRGSISAMSAFAADHVQAKAVS